MNRPAIGFPAPNFISEDCYGHPIALSSFQDKNHVLLVFNRSLL